MSESEGLNPTLLKIQKLALLAGVVGLGSLAAGFVTSGTDHEAKLHVWMSYLFAFVFWMSIPLGSLAILMLQHLTGGAWALVIRRALEASTRVLPIMALLFIPLIFGVKEIYVWAGPERSLHGIALKEFWLTERGFICRGITYFVLWNFWAFLLNKWSKQQDTNPSQRLNRRMSLFSGPGILMYGVTVTFAGIDWVMSLDPHWFSTIWGLLFIAGQGLATFSFMVVVLALLSAREPLKSVVTRTHFHDLGNLMLAFTILWAYMNFSQFLIIWSGNIPEETPYYFNRTRGGWQIVGMFLVICHFFIPLLLLLSRTTKRAVKVLATLAVCIVTMRIIDLYWVVVPQYYQGHFHLQPDKWVWNPYWTDLAAPIGIGGIFIFFFIWQLKRRPILPPNDPRLAGLGGHHD